MRIRLNIVEVRNNIEVVGENKSDEVEGTLAEIYSIKILDSASN